MIGPIGDLYDGDLQTDPAWQRAATTQGRCLLLVGSSLDLSQAPQDLQEAITRVNPITCPCGANRRCQWPREKDPGSVSRTAPAEPSSHDHQDGPASEAAAHNHRDDSSAAHPSQPIPRDKLASSTYRSTFDGNTGARSDLYACR